MSQFGRAPAAGLTPGRYGSSSAPAKKTITLEEWERMLAAVRVKKEDLNELVMDYLVTEGFAEAARVFREETGGDCGEAAAALDMKSLEERDSIRVAVQKGNIEEAIERVNDLSPEILEERQQLTFHLQQQRLIELIRRGQVEEALEFAQEYLAPRGEENPEFLQELEKTLALLAFQEASASPLGTLLGDAQRQKTASELNEAILGAQNQNTEAKLPMLVKMMLWAEKELADKVNFPRMEDIATGRLSSTVAAGDAAAKPPGS